MHYNLKRTDVYCATVDLSKACNKINIRLLCEKMTEAILLGQVIALIHFLDKKKNTFVCTSYGGQLSDECSVKNVVRQGGI